MDEDILKKISIGIEFGLPVVLVLVSTIKPKYRCICLPVLGVLAVPIGAFIFILLGYHFINPEEFEYGYHVVWVMSLAMYCILAVIGLVLAIVLRKPSSNIAKFSAGVVLGVFMLIGFSMVS